ncbi:MAG: hypothetical protein WB902_05595 [Acetobacteraceae bacterium]|jgi:hypothetical protein
MKSARWTEETGWIVEDLQHDFWQPPTHPNRRFTTAMWVLMLIGASLISWSALAHNPSCPELTSRLHALPNAHGESCEAAAMRRAVIPAHLTVVPAKAGTQAATGSRFRGDDDMTAGVS